MRVTNVFAQFMIWFFATLCLLVATATLLVQARLGFADVHETEFFSSVIGCWMWCYDAFALAFMGWWFWLVWRLRALLPASPPSDLPVTPDILSHRRSVELAHGTRRSPDEHRRSRRRSISLLFRPASPLFLFFYLLAAVILRMDRRLADASRRCFGAGRAIGVCRHRGRENERGRRSLLDRPAATKQTRHIMKRFLTSLLRSLSVFGA